MFPNLPWRAFNNWDSFLLFGSTRVKQNISTYLQHSTVPALTMENGQLFVENIVTVITIGIYSGCNLATSD